jgi:hypothetical protein
VNRANALSLGAVPRFLTLYLACTPCTASTSHAAWEIAARLQQESGSGQHGSHARCRNRSTSAHGSSVHEVPKDLGLYRILGGGIFGVPLNTQIPTSMIL